MSDKTIPTLIICVSGVDIQRFRVEVAEREQEYLECCNGFSFDDLYGGDMTAWNYVTHRLGNADFYNSEEGLARELPDLQGRKYLDWESYGTWRNELDRDDCGTKGATKVFVLRFTRLI